MLAEIYMKVVLANTKPYGSQCSERGEAVMGGLAKMRQFEVVVAQLACNRHRRSVLPYTRHWAVFNAEANAHGITSHTTQGLLQRSHILVRLLKLVLHFEVKAQGHKISQSSIWRYPTHFYYYSVASWQGRTGGSCSFPIFGLSKIVGKFSSIRG